MERETVVGERERARERVDSERVEIRKTTSSLGEDCFPLTYIRLVLHRDRFLHLTLFTFHSFQMVGK